MNFVPSSEPPFAVGGNSKRDPKEETTVIEETNVFEFHGCTMKHMCSSMQAMLAKKLVILENLSNYFSFCIL